MPMPAHIAVDSNDRLNGGDVAGECDAGKPRLRRSFALPAPGLPPSTYLVHRVRFLAKILLAMSQI
jgi:hypothetical protein